MSGHGVPLMPVSTAFFKTLQQTLQHPFSAFAELSDNARDANATEFHITLSPDQIECRDNGPQCKPDDILDILTLGHSTKAFGNAESDSCSMSRSKSKRMGMYGVGLDNGAYSHALQRKHMPMYPIP